MDVAVALDEVRQITLGGQLLLLRALDTKHPSDMSALLSLHREVFRSAADPKWFGWKYQTGGAIGFGLWRGDDLVAHCGGIPRDFLLPGTCAPLLQIGDVMVAPRWRGVFARSNPFTLVSRALYEGTLGRGRKYPIGFGFPNARHMRLAVKTGLANHPGDIAELSWNRAASAASLGPWWRVEMSDAPGMGDVERAWRNMRQDSAVARMAVGVRDWRHLRWRYLERPDRRYRFALMRRPWQRDACGVLVLSDTAPLQWLDWIGPPSWIGVAAKAATIVARDLQSEHIGAWCSPAVAAALSESAPIARQVVAAIGVPVASDAMGYEPSRFPWWLMGGDTDFL